MDRSDTAFAWFVMRSALVSALGLAIAIAAGGVWTDAGLEFAWGVVLFGAFFGMVIPLLVVTVALIQKWREKQATAESGSKAVEIPRRLRDFTYVSWKGNVGFLIALTVVALVDPETAARFAALPIGAVAVGFPLILFEGYVINQVRRRLAGPAARS